MSGARIQRRLSAIVATDIVGYSRMMGRDEAGTLRRLKSFRAELFDPKVGEFGGRIVKTTGDGALIEFPSAVDAVSHALDLQRCIAVRNAALPDDERIHLRIGINVGDVIIDDDDIYGDGVNVAARLEALADAGGILLSASAHDHARRGLDVAFEDLGQRSVKNIAEPVHVFRVKGGDGGATAPPPPAAEAARDDAGAAYPTVAVLPFARLGEDPDQGFFAEGLTEDLITALCRVPQLLVIARDSSAQFRDGATPARDIAARLGARYLVQGGVRSAGARLRVTVHLTDGTTGNYIWSDRYDRAAEDVFAVQDDIVKRVLVEMQVALTVGESARLESGGTESLEAWLLQVRGWSTLTRWDRESTLAACRLFQDAHAADPDWGPPLMGHGISLRELAVRNWSAAPEDDFHRGLALVEQAVERAPDDAFTVSQLGETYILMGRVEDGIPLCERALAQAPNDSRVLGSTAMNFIRAGRHDRALALFDRLRRVSPLPVRFNIANEGLALHMIGRHADAERLLSACADTEDGAVRLAALYSGTGRLDAARALIAQLRTSNPDAATGQFAGRLLFADPARAARYAGLLEAAGLPQR